MTSRKDFSTNDSQANPSILKPRGITSLSLLLEADIGVDDDDDDDEDKGDLIFTAQAFK
jgi:hypothetical protein